MSGFSEDERIRHKNEKFGDSFTKKSDDISLVFEDVTLTKFIESLRKQGLKVTLGKDNTMIISSGLELDIDHGPM